MATVTTETEPQDDFRPYRMTLDRFEQLAASGVYEKIASIFLSNGRLVEKIREGVEPTLDGDFPEHRLTSNRFIQLVEAGVFAEDKHLFLWHGSLVEKMTKGRPHAFAALKLEQFRMRRLPDEFHVELEQSLKLSEDSVPEPDLMVLRGTLDDFQKRMPEGRDVALVVEVTDSSPTKDSKKMLRAYALASLPIYGMVNIRKNRIEVYSDPSGPSDSPASYRTRDDYSMDDEIPIVIDGREVGRITMRVLCPHR